MWFPRAALQIVAWIGHGGTIAWPPRSPDLAPPDFRVWVYINGKVFGPPLPSSLENLRAQITEEVATTNVDMICRILEVTAYRCDMRKPHLTSVDKT
jgi:hypothetical protein